jgi:hypothetical protein
MPFVPKIQATAIGRYNVDFGSFPGYVQAAVSYTSDTWNLLEIAPRTKQPAYTIVNLATGIDKETWSLNLFLDNVTDKRAQLTRYDNGYFDPFGSITGDTVITTNRPRTIGLRYGRRF